MATRLSIIVPFHRGLGFLERCLAALHPLPPGGEIIVAADGAVDDCTEVAARHGARVIRIDGPRGPAVARNRAAAVAAGDVLLFVDTDVIAAPSAVPGVVGLFDRDPGMAALFGAYDDTPGHSGFVSQYKNLAHSFVHRASAGPAQTFWAGFGAVRKDAFDAVGGFDERFARPSVEDIDLGYRLTRAGHRIMLEPSLQSCHLKHWTTRGMISSDVFDRGIPWTQLILKYGQMNSGLNVQSSYKLCVVVAYAAVAALLLALIDPRALIAVPLLLLVIWWLGRGYYAYFARQRGLLFAARVFPLHVLYHFYNGVSFGLGTLLFTTRRWFGVALPGSIPPDTWAPRGAAHTRDASSRTTPAVT